MQFLLSAQRTSARIRRSLVRGGSRRPWVLSTLGIAVGFLALALAVSMHIGIPIRDPEGTLLGRRLLLPFVFMCIFLAMDVFVRARRLWRAGDLEPIPALRLTFLERWWWQRMAIAMVGFSAFHMSYLAYRNLKSFLPLIDYRTWDQELLQLDRWMAFGAEPAVVVHRLLGEDLAAHALSTVYLAFIPLVPISVAAALTFTDRLRDGYVYVAASIYCWIFGTLSYYLLPSLGPFGGDREQFDGLAYTGVTRLQEILISQRVDFYSDPVGETMIQGVAGFASLHVAIVFMAWVYCRQFGHRVLAWACMAFLVPTTVATIYFGWHYIVDDVAGLFIGWFAVVSARLTIYPGTLLSALGRSPRPGAGSRSTVQVSPR